MLQKIKYDALNFDKYDKMKEMVMNPETNLNAITILELNNFGASNLPEIKCFALFPKLTTLILSENKINKFDANSILKGAPLLEILDLKNNFINNLEDIIDLGSLK